MDLLVKIFNIANTEMPVPTTFGLFHLICVGAVVLLTAFLCLTCKNCSERAMKRITAFVWVVLVVLEIYKQLVFSIVLENGSFGWDYAWYIFPFQFCSSPLYILPIIAFCRSERVCNACVAYMMTFSLFAGLAVFCYPNDVFIETAGINVQTMVHHGSQIIMGVFYGVRYRRKHSAKFFLGGVLVFVAMVFIAMALNVGVYRMFGELGIDETFNMFYISPYFPCTLPVLSTVWELIPYEAFVCVYFFGFILSALLVYTLIRLAAKGIKGEFSSRRAEKMAYERDCIFYYNL